MPSSNDRSWDRDDRPRRRDDDYDDRPRRRDGGGEAAAAGISGALIVGIIVGVFVFGLIVVGLLVALLLPAVQKVREAAGRTKDLNNLKQISLGAHFYADRTGTLPPADGDLSWRVHILPYIEQDSLHKQFDLKQPWDSPKNKPLASNRIPTYTNTNDMASGTAETRYRVFVGPNTLFPPGKPPLGFGNIPDGSSNTIFAVESSDLVPWSQPKELVYDRNGALPALGDPQRSPAGFLVAMADGSVRFVKAGVSDKSLRAGIEPADGLFFMD